jgi:hypothetical protein
MIFSKGELIASRTPTSTIQAGQLWKVWVNNFKYAKSPFPGAKYGFDWEVSYNPSITMVDMQLEHATACSLPSSRFESEQGWYINWATRKAPRPSTSR